MKPWILLILTLAFANVLIAQSPDGISCPPNVLMNTDPGSCNASHIDLVSPASIGSFVFISMINDAPSAFEKGITLVKWTASDVSGNTATCIQTVIVKDNEPPAITCVDDHTLSTNPGLGNFTVQDNEFDPVHFSDNCPGSTITNDYNNLNTLAGVVFPKGSTTITWIVTDLSYNTTTCTFNIHVSDNEEPFINCISDQDRSTDSNTCTYTVKGSELDPAFTDNCPGPNIINNINNGNTLAGVEFPKGKTTVIWTATDASSNTSKCIIDVSVNDNEAPAIACTGNEARSTDPWVCTYITAGNEFDPVSFSDNCNGSIITNDYNGLNTLAGAVFNKGTTVVTWTVLDAGGNVAFCNLAVIVKDNEAPYIICPGDQFKNTNPGVCSYTVMDNELDPSYFIDNCPGSTITNDFNALQTLTGAAFPKGTTIVTWIVTDLSFNTTTCRFNIQVTDNEDPVILCMANLEINTDQNSCTYIVSGNELYPAFTDNCSGSTIINDFNSQNTLAGIVLPKGTTTITWTVSDASNNIATCISGITIIDNELPVIGCVGNMIRNATSGASNYITVGTEFDPVYFSDNCNGSVIINDYNGLNTLAGTVFPIGKTVVTWMVFDASLNMEICSFDITVYEDDDQKIINKNLNKPYITDKSTDPLSPGTSIAGKMDIQFGNYPNPFKEKTMIKFMLPQEKYVKIEIYDMSGKAIQTLYKGTVKKDQEYAAEFNGSGLSNGFYICKMTTDSNIITSTMMHVRE
jgi:large repetitive protein